MLILFHYRCFGRIPIKLQLAGKFRLIFNLSQYNENICTNEKRLIIIFSINFKMSVICNCARWFLFEKKSTMKSEATTYLVNIMHYKWMTFSFSLQDTSRLYFQKFPFTFDFSFVIYIYFLTFDTAIKLSKLRCWLAFNQVH